MSYKVLIVDDSKLARMAVNRVLNVLYPDWARVEAASSEEALLSIEQAHPDIALLDFNMPGRNGLELAADLRQSNPQMQVAVISANRQQEILNRATAMGAAFLGKPLTEEALAAFLKSAVRALGGSAS